MPREGLPAAAQKPFAAEMPMRMPVNEPGPVTAQKKAHFSGTRAARESVSSTAESRRSLWRMAQFSSKVTKVFSPLRATTVR